MSCSHFIGTYASYDSKITRETIVKINVENIFKLINSAVKSNDNTDHKDTDEEFTLVMSVKRKSKLTGKAADKIQKFMLQIITSKSLKLHVSKVNQKMKS